jgi:hypothetical protein
MTGTYDVIVMGSNVGQFSVSGDMVTSFTATWPCSPMSETSNFGPVPINTSTTPHTFNDTNVGGAFEPGGAEGQYVNSMSGCHFTWTATLRPAQPPPTITKTPTVVKESARFAVFLFTLSHSMQTRFTIQVDTSDGTAKEGKDYLPVHGSVTFQPGQTQKEILVPILEDKRDEKRKEVFFLSSPQDGRTTGGIKDNDVDPLTGCKCDEARLLRPKKLKPEAFLFQTADPGGGSPQPLPTSNQYRFVNVRIPLRWIVKCSPPAQPGGCSAELAHDQNFFQASWNAPDVKDLHVLPRRHTCSAKCNEKEEQEVWFIYTGWVTGLQWPTEGTLRFRWTIICEGKKHKVTVEAKVTFPYTPTQDNEAVPGTVELDYNFGK